jgi:hypothetical protein
VSNFIFSRRALQSVIHRPATAIEPESVQSIVARMNRPESGRFLPKRGTLLQLFVCVTKDRFQEVRDAPDKPSRFRYAEGDIAFALTYDPAQRYATGR